MPTGLCLAALALLIALTSLSGVGWDGWSAMLAELQAGATIAIHEPVVPTLLERLFTFLPLGFLLQRKLGRRGWRRPSLVAWIGIVGFAFAIELAQVPVAGRHARLSDLLLAMAFGTIGLLISEWLGAPPAMARLRALLMAVLVLGNAIVGSVIVQSHRAAELRGWDCDYPLLVANERTGDRPWLGRIREFAIYDRVPLPEASLATFNFARHAGGRVWSGGQTNFLLPPASEASWQIEDGALAVLRPLVVTSTTGSRQICEAIMSTGSFALEATIASASDSQQGPARIVSQSTSPMARNFTLGQEGSALVFRVRTPWTGTNGDLHSAWVEHALQDGAWHQVLATYAEGVATVFLDGRERTSIRYYELIALSESLVVRLGVVALAGFAAMGLIVGWLEAGASWRTRLGHAWLGAALVPTSLALVMTWRLGHGVDWVLLAAAVGGPVIGVLGLAAWSRVREAPRWRPGASVAAAAGCAGRVRSPLPCARPSTPR